MLIKVYGGTQIQDGESLCDTCVHSRITRGRRLEEELVMCTALMMHAVQITFKVTSCSVYVDDREPSYHELCEKALTSCTTPRGDSQCLSRIDQLQ